MGWFDSIMGLNEKDLDGICHLIGFGHGIIDCIEDSILQYFTIFCCLTLAMEYIQSYIIEMSE